MANNRWNSRNPDSRNTAQIACKLCSHVFSNKEALIAHIHSHLAYEEIALRSFHQTYLNTSQRETSRNHQFVPNSLRANTLSVQETNGNISVTWAARAPPQPEVVLPLRKNPNFLSAFNLPYASPQPPSLGLSSSRNTNRGATVQQSQRRNLEEMSTIEATRPFIDLLERPIKKIKFIDLVNINDDESSLRMLDLTLKL